MARRFDIILLLIQLHWLMVCFKMQFKILVLCLEVLYNFRLRYLKVSSPHHEAALEITWRSHSKWSCTIIGHLSRDDLKESHGILVKIAVGEPRGELCRVP